MCVNYTTDPYLWILESASDPSMGKAKPGGKNETKPEPEDWNNPSNYFLDFNLAGHIDKSIFKRLIYRFRGQ